MMRLLVAFLVFFNKFPLSDAFLTRNEYDLQNLVLKLDSGTKNNDLWQKGRDADEANSIGMRESSLMTDTYVVTQSRPTSSRNVINNRYYYNRGSPTNNPIMSCTLGELKATQSCSIEFYQCIPPGRFIKRNCMADFRFDPSRKRCHPLSEMPLCSRNQLPIVEVSRAVPKVTSLVPVISDHSTVQYSSPSRRRMVYVRPAFDAFAIPVPTHARGGDPFSHVHVAPQEPVEHPFRTDGPTDFQSDDAFSVFKLPQSGFDPFGIPHRTDGFVDRFHLRSGPNLQYRPTFIPNYGKPSTYRKEPKRHKLFDVDDIPSKEMSNFKKFEPEPEKVERRPEEGNLEEEHLKGSLEKNENKEGFPRKMEGKEEIPNDKQNNDDFQLEKQVNNALDTGENNEDIGDRKKEKDVLNKKPVSQNNKPTAKDDTRPEIFKERFGEDIGKEYQKDAPKGKANDFPDEKKNDENISRGKENTILNATENKEDIPYEKNNALKTKPIPKNP